MIRIDRRTGWTGRCASGQVVLAVAVLCLASVCRGEESRVEGYIADALEAVRHRSNGSDILQSAKLGQLATPAELAAAQPDFREIFAARSPLDIPFNEVEQQEIFRDYRYFTFRGAPRSAEIIPMGITGAHLRGMQLKPELIITAVEPDTPADGVLRVDDIIIGANGHRFRDRRDPRIPLGYALAESQTEKLDGTLTLTIVRQGKPLNVKLKLGVSGEYSRTWPYDCPRSQRIANDMVDFVVDNVAGASRHSGGGFWAPLFLMASGDDRAVEAVRRQLYGRTARIQKTWEPAYTSSGHSWNSGYALVTFCEYYLLTGDSEVLPTIRYYKEILEKGQSAAGGWGHGCPCSGYGEVNNCGAVAFMGLALARQCGMEMDERALPKAIHYFGRFIGGNMPYGNHTGSVRAGRGDNGSTSMGTLAYHFLGATDVSYRWGRTVSYMWGARERGHAEGIFNMAWGPQGAVLGPREEFNMFMNNMIWYYEMARTREGGIHFMRGGHFPYPIGQTTAVGLAYLLPRKQIYITGAPKSVFAMKPPNAELQKAAELYKQKQWPQVKQLLTAYTAKKSNPHQDYAAKLLAAYERLEQSAVFAAKQIEQNIQKNNLALAQKQLATLTHFVGNERPEYAALRAKLPTWEVKATRRFKRPKIEPQTTLLPYFAEAQTTTDQANTFEWETVMPSAAEAKQTLKERYDIRRVEPGQAPDLGAWYKPDYKMTGWNKYQGPFTVQDGEQVYIRRSFKTLTAPSKYKLLQLVTSGGTGVVYLNGYRIAEVKSGELNLRAGIIGVLAKRGTPNLLAACFTAGSRVDIELNANPPAIPNLDDALDGF